MKPQIVIIGGGAGGLVLATKLGNTLGKRNKANIVLVDASPTHLWKPRLHEVAAGALNSHVDELAYAAHARKHHFRFVLGRMAGLDRETRKVKLAAYRDYDDHGEVIIPERDLAYDDLVIALGSQTNDFATEGASENCIFLDSRAAAEKLHKSFLNTYLRASSKSHAEQDLQGFNIAIVGAGATGVELAAELTHAARELELYGFDSIRPEQVSISIIEASDRVMPPLLPKASEAIQRQLEKLKIKIYTGERVVKVDEGALYTASGKVIPAQLKVWSAGIKAAPMLSEIPGLETNHLNQIKVKPTLQSTTDEHIFALGDCAEYIPAGSTKAVPPRAQVAGQQALFLAKSFRKRLANAPLPQFVFKDKGSLVSLSKYSSVGQLMGNLSGDFTFEGKLARLFYVTLYRMHQLSLHGVLTSLLLVIRDRLNQRTGASVKLH